MFWDIVLSYYYSSLAAKQIVELASEDIRSNARIQAHDLGSILSNALNSVATNLGILTILQETVEQQSNIGNSIFDILQQSSSGLSVQYLQLDHDGQIIWSNGSGSGGGEKKEEEAALRDGSCEYTSHQTSR